MWQTDRRTDGQTDRRTCEVLCLHHYRGSTKIISIWPNSTLCDLNIWPNDNYLLSNRQGVTYVYLPPKFGKKLFGTANLTEHIMKWPKFDLFDLLTLCDLNIWPNDYYLVRYRQGVTHAYLPPKFGKKMLKTASPTEVILNWVKIWPFDLVWPYYLTLWLSGESVARSQPYLPTTKILTII